jgi:hypothetical protein
VIRTDGPRVAGFTNFAFGWGFLLLGTVGIVGPELFPIPVVDSAASPPWASLLTPSASGGDPLGEAFITTSLESGASFWISSTEAGGNVWCSVSRGCGKTGFKGVAEHFKIECKCSVADVIELLKCAGSDGAFGRAMGERLEMRVCISGTVVVISTSQGITPLGELVGGPDLSIEANLTFAIGERESDELILSTVGGFAASDDGSVVWGDPRRCLGTTISRSLTSKSCSSWLTGAGGGSGDVDLGAEWAGRLLTLGSAIFSETKISDGEAPMSVAAAVLGIVERERASGFSLVCGCRDCWATERNGAMLIIVSEFGVVDGSGSFGMIEACWRKICASLDALLGL